MTQHLQHQFAVPTKGVVADTYGYDALGRRVYIATATSSGSATNWMVYDRLQCVADLDAAGSVLRSYTYGPGVDNLLAFTVYGGSTTNTYYPLTDHLGTVHAVANSSGTVVESYRYDAWGNLLEVLDANGDPISNRQSAIGNRFLFQGREYSWAVHAANGGAGLYNFRARWYDPATGRWLSNDPIGISGGLNQYAFCGNNSVNFVDPSGLAHLIVYGNRRGDSKAKIASKRASSSGYSSGHVWVEFSYNDTECNPQTVNRGNYPKTFGGYQDDSARNGIADFSHAFYVPDDRVEEVLRELWTYDSFGPLGHNCVDSLEEVLDKAGIDHPGFGWPSDPRSVENWLREKSNPFWMSPPPVPSRPGMLPDWKRPM